MPSTQNPSPVVYSISQMEMEAVKDLQNHQTNQQLTNNQTCCNHETIGKQWYTSTTTKLFKPATTNLSSTILHLFDMFFALDARTYSVLHDRSTLHRGHRLDLGATGHEVTFFGPATHRVIEYTQKATMSRGSKLKNNQQLRTITGYNRCLIGFLVSLWMFSRLLLGF